MQTDKGKHTEFTVCLSLSTSLMHSRRVVFMSQLFPEDQDELQKTENSLGSTTCSDLISWAGTDSHMATWHSFDIVHKMPFVGLACVTGFKSVEKSVLFRLRHHRGRLADGRLGRARQPDD